MTTAVASLLRNALFAGASEPALTTLGVAKPSDLYAAVKSLPKLNLSTITLSAQRGIQSAYAHCTLKNTFAALIAKPVAVYSLFQKKLETSTVPQALKFTAGKEFVHIKSAAGNCKGLFTESSFGRLATMGLLFSSTRLGLNKLVEKYSSPRPESGLRRYLRIPNFVSQGLVTLTSAGLATAATYALCSQTNLFGNRQVALLDIANDLGSIILFNTGLKALGYSSRALAWTTGTLSSAVTWVSDTQAATQKQPTPPPPKKTPKVRNRDLNNSLKILCTQVHDHKNDLFEIGADNAQGITDLTSAIATLQQEVAGNQNDLHKIRTDIVQIAAILQTRVSKVLEDNFVEVGRVLGTPAQASAVAALAAQLAEIRAEVQSLKELVEESDETFYDASIPNATDTEPANAEVQADSTDADGTE